MTIVDLESGKLVAEKIIGDGPDSAAFDADLGMIFCANGDEMLTIVKQHDPDHYAVLKNLRTTKGVAPWCTTRQRILPTW
jgi:hypothetical protein